jgi:phosphate transport system substrate-binding protein
MAWADRATNQERIMRRTQRVLGTLAIAGVLGAAAGAACAGGKLNGSIHVDGSSTVFPITEAVAEEFRAVQPEVRVSVGFSGTGGGFKKFAIGETDINDASRPIKAEEMGKAAEHDIGFIELPVAYDGLSVVVNPKNDFVDHLTVEELHRIWMPESQVKTWKDVRPSFPAEKISLYGAGTDSGTFDYFTEVINGKAQACRSDFTASEDDNVLVQGIAGDRWSLGFFGYAYYAENRSKVKVVPIDGGAGPVTPSAETINNGTYAPLSRPIFIYVATTAAARPEVSAFVNFYLASAPQLVSEVGYVPLPDEVYALAVKRFEARLPGTVYGEGSKGKTLAELFAMGTSRT